jgi:hypothetical protein
MTKEQALDQAKKMQTPAIEKRKDDFSTGYKAGYNTGKRHGWEHSEDFLWELKAALDEDIREGHIAELEKLVKESLDKIQELEAKLDATHDN